MTSRKTIILFWIFAGMGLAIVPLVVLGWMMQSPPSRPPLEVRLDPQGPYVILATARAAKDYPQAIQKMVALHPDAVQESFEPADLDATLNVLKKWQPRYVLTFMEPEALDVNFAWRWVTMSTLVDDDPLVDFSTGFITGVDPQAVNNFVQRISDAASGSLKLPGALVDNLGPPEQANEQFFRNYPGAFMVPVYLQRLTASTINHGKGSFTDEHLDAMNGAGIVHFGGHGHPDRIDDGLIADQVEKLQLSPSVIFNGACYTGVTNRWFDVAAFPPAPKEIEPQKSFCLKLLANQAVAYLAAVHPDHGMPVYQEMEHLAYSGASLGDLMKRTHDSVVLGAGGKLPALDPIGPATPAATSPTEVMLKGTAARLLFGDPALIVGTAFTDEPFFLNVTDNPEQLLISASVRNTKLLSEYTDTFHNDLNPQSLFNDRALLRCELPARWTEIDEVLVDQVTAKRAPLKSRVVGFAIEQDQGKRWLHVQVDVPSTAFQKSAFRESGSTVTLIARRGKKGK